MNKEETLRGRQEKLIKLYQEILGITEIGIDDDFFILGGDSLKAAVLASKISKSLKVTVPLGEIFITPTVRELAQYIDNYSGAEGASSPQSEETNIPRVEEREYYPVSSSQKRMYLLEEQVKGNEPVYNTPGMVVIEGQLDGKRLEEAFKILIRRHESLRTSFEIKNGEPVQIIWPEVDFGLSFEEAAEEDVAEIYQNFIYPFDLSRAPLLRAKLLTLCEYKYVLMLDLHHIITDGTSMGVFMRDLAALYSGETLVPLSIRYRDYSLWEKEMLGSEVRKASGEYWLSKFAHEVPVLDLPADYPRPAEKSFAGNRIAFRLEKTLSSRLNQLAVETGTTMFMVLFAGYTVLLSKYTAQEEVVVGSAASWRPDADLENLIGMFVNTIALKSHPLGSKKFIELLAEVKQDAFASFANQHYPFEELVSSLKLQGDLSRNPLFDIVFVMQNVNISEVEAGGLRFSPFKLEGRGAKFDLTLQAFEDGEEILFELEYSTDLFKQETIEGLARHLTNILKNVVHDPHVRLADLDWLSEEEKGLVLSDFGHYRPGDFAASKPIHLLFEEQAAKHPNNIAVVLGDASLTYKELNEKANSLTRFLRAKGLGSSADSIVAVLTPPCPEMIIAILAVLKAGAAYLPIDPAFPSERISYILEDSGAKLLLKHETLTWEENSLNVIDLGNQEVYSADGSNPAYASEVSDLAYIIYTSGSTGKPKGVLVEHKSLSNFLCAIHTSFNQAIGPQDNCLALANISFDVSVCEIFLPLVFGATLVLLETAGVLEVKILVNTILQKAITFAYIPPTLLWDVCQALKLMIQDLVLDKLLVGVEPIKGYVLEAYLELNPKMQILNGYGPTETTICATIYKYRPKMSRRGNVPIGKPLMNTGVFILDKYLKPVAVGVPGEICVLGAGLARGYLNKPELTMEKFIANPYCPAQRMYRTGDVAHWLPDGNIEFLGRIDNQVKIRGFRIELGEIESHLLKHPAVKEGVVVAREENDSKYICAYIVTNREVSVSVFREYLLQQLPGYMVPSYFVLLAHLPLTPNGKIDRRALPQPRAGFSPSIEWEVPGNETEVKLAQIWRDILAIPKVSVTQNFFELGGHSLKAASLVSRVHKEFNVEVPLREIFKNPTIKELAAYVRNAEQSKYLTIRWVEERECYPLASAQKRLYLLYQAKDLGTSYNMPVAFTLKGALDRERLGQAILELVKKHEPLRTFFAMADGEPVQKLNKDPEFRVDYLEVGEEEVQEIIKGLIKPFDLAKAPLLRVTLIKTGENESVIFIDMPHIISDGISMNLLYEELSFLYQGREISLPRIRYTDYVLWQKEMQEGEFIRKQENYWLDVFSGEAPLLNMPTDFKRPPVRSFQGASLSFRAEQQAVRRLRKLALETETTAYVLLLAIYNVLLTKYTGQEDIIIGSVTSGRPHGDLDRLIGMFVNTLALRNFPRDHKSFRQFLLEVRENTFGAFENQDYQFDELVEKLNQPLDASRNPLFDTMFVMQNMGNSGLSLEGLEVQPFGLENKTAKFDFLLNTFENLEDFRFELEYCTELFTKETMKRMAGHFLNIMNQVLDNPDITLAEIELISEQEKKEILFEFNDTRSEYPRDKAIHRLFEEQVELTPDLTALVYAEQCLTYRELNERANKLAWQLATKGINHGAIVPIVAERSLEMVLGIISILKAGGAYLPIDPKLPRARIDYMLTDSRAGVILVQSSWVDKFKFRQEIVAVDLESQLTGDKGNLSPKGGPDSLSYIMYTSGSTGNPKGVMVKHRNVVRLVKNTNYLEFTPGDRMLQTGSVVFDACTFEIWGSLLNGLCLHLAEESVILDAPKLEQALIENKISILWLTSPLFNQLSQCKNDMFRTLKYLLVGGDVLSPRHIAQVRDACQGLRIINGYGPTENTTFSACHQIERNYTDIIPIGKPLSNSTIYVVDRNRKLLPVGVPGELWVGGEGVALGYLNQPELTAEKFIPDPFLTASSTSLVYKTGDLARWLPDGSLEFLGRIDNQVKIRGYRIELSEIENNLLDLEGIREAVVIVREDRLGDKFLGAYFTASGEILTAELRRHLAKKLPDYMLPSYYVQLKELPLTPNGKIDRGALPVPDGLDYLETDYKAPTNETEERLANIWRGLLGIRRIGIEQNFFAAGGHSLKAASLVSRIHKEFDVEITLRELFNNPTIKDLALLIKNSEYSKYLAIQPAEDSDYYPASSAQKRIYVLSQVEGSGINYNIPAAFSINGHLDGKGLEDAFKALIIRQEALRTSFALEAGEPVQKISDIVEFELKVFEVVNNKVEEIIKGFIQPFDLRKAPLFRAALLKTGEEKSILLLDMHHIIADGISTNTLFEELAALYESRSLPNLNIRYKDYAVWQKKLQNSSRVRQQEEYWLNVFRAEIPLLNMQTDFPRPPFQSFAGKTLYFSADQELVYKLKRLAYATGATMYITLLALFNVVLSKYTGQEDIIVGSVTSGRPNSELERVIGMFANTIAQRNYPQAHKSFTRFLNEVKENTFAALDNQDYQFEEMVSKMDIHKDLSRNPIFDTVFVMQNMDIRPIEISGLEIKPFALENESAKFDFTLQAYEVGEEIKFELEYCTRLFRQETMERFAGHFLNVLRQVAENQEIRLAEIDLLSPEEGRKILLFNKTKTEYPLDKTINQMIEEQVELTPDKVALVFDDKYVTYKELNENANSIADKLREKNVKPDTIIAILSEQSRGMVTGMLGVLKAGGAFLPIDPSYPAERISYILADSGATILMTRSYAGKKFDFSGELIDLDDPDLYRQGVSNPERTNCAKDLAYVIYTSGSTGKPKGVLIEHRSLVNLCYWHQEFYAISSADKSTKYAGPGFDASVWEVFPYLCTGAEIHIISEDLKLDLVKLNKYYEAKKITISFLPTQVCEQFIRLENCSLRILLTGGDKLHHSVKTNYEIVNNYGPTENTVVTTVFPINGSYDNIPIGKPINNTKVYILDSSYRMRPVGLAGELCIGGAGLARGYLNRPELTAEKFVPNPFAPGELMYKTGDLARWLPDGNLEFLGRMDNQVKIRGFRIELGEIERSLLEFGIVKENVVIVREESRGDKDLVAYFVAEEEVESSQLREFLVQKLPGYMVPSYFIQLPKIPLTRNGKIDKRSLPAPRVNIERDKEWQPPSTPVEMKLAAIWEELLGRERVGLVDSFFDLGGHSLKATALIGKIHEEFGKEVPLRQIFKTPTIKQLALFIQRADLLSCFADEGIVLLRKGIEGDQQFFFIHDGTGEIGGYIEFSNFLDPRFSYWGISSDRSANYGPQNISVSELARKYIKKIQNMQPDGPYFLGGWSTGGIIAFEIIRQLEDSGNKIGYAAIIDSPVPRSPQGRAEFPGEFSPASEKLELRRYPGGPEFLAELQSSPDLSLIWDEFVKYLLEKKPDLLPSFKEAINPEIARAIPNFNQAGIKELVYYLNAVRTFGRAVATYTSASKVKAQVHFFAAFETGINREEWSSCCELPVRCFSIPGDHFSILKQPGVSVLAEMFNETVKNSPVGTKAE